MKIGELIVLWLYNVNSLSLVQNKQQEQIYCFQLSRL